MLGLSEVNAWTPDYLDRAAAQWIASSIAWDEAYARARQQARAPGGTMWTGAAASAAEETVNSDSAQVLDAAESLLAAASAARSGAGEICTATQQVLEVVKQAEYAGFSVAEDYAVTPLTVSGSTTSQNALRLQAEVFAADIRTRVQALVALDGDVASRITSAAAGLGTIIFGGRQSTTRRHRDQSIQLVDNRVLKESPIPDPGIEPGATGAPPPAPSAAAIRNAIKDLPSGTEPKFLEVRDAEQLRRFGDWATKGAHEYTSPNPYRGGRDMHRLPDGTVVGQGPSTKHGLTMDVKFPDGEYYRIHVNERSGGNINMPRAAVIEPRVGMEPRIFEPATRPGIPIVGVPKLVDSGGGGPGINEGPVLDAGGGIFDTPRP